MQRRSWMAALTLAALAGAPARADEPASVKPAGEPAPASKAEGPASIKRKVALNFHLANLYRASEVTVKPGNPACRFKPFTLPITQQREPTRLQPIEIETFSADRDCSLVITLNEPGKPVKTMRRNFRIEAVLPGVDAPQVFECYLSAVPMQPAATVAEKTTGTAKAKK